MGITVHTLYKGIHDTALNCFTRLNNISSHVTNDKRKLEREGLNPATPAGMLVGSIVEESCKNCADKDT